MSTTAYVFWRNKKNVNTLGLKKKHLIKSNFITIVPSKYDQYELKSYDTLLDGFL